LRTSKYRSDRAGMKQASSDVRARIDAREHEIRLEVKTANGANDDAQRRRGFEGKGGNGFGAEDCVALVFHRGMSEYVADGGRHARIILMGGNHHCLAHFARRAALNPFRNCSRKCRDPGRVDSVVVSYQNTHPTYVNWPKLRGSEEGEN